MVWGINQHQAFEIFNMLQDVPALANGKVGEDGKAPPPLVDSGNIDVLMDGGEKMGGIDPLEIECSKGELSRNRSSSADISTHATPSLLSLSLSPFIVLCALFFHVIIGPLGVGIIGDFKCTRKGEAVGAYSSHVVAFIIYLLVNATVYITLIATQSSLKQHSARQLLGTVLFLLSVIFITMVTATKGAYLKPQLPSCAEQPDLRSQVPTGQCVERELGNESIYDSLCFPQGDVERVFVWEGLIDKYDIDLPSLEELFASLYALGTTVFPEFISIIKSLVCNMFFNPCDHNCLVRLPCLDFLRQLGSEWIRLIPGTPDVLGAIRDNCTGFLSLIDFGEFGSILTLFGDKVGKAVLDFATGLNVSCSNVLTVALNGTLHDISPNCIPIEENVSVYDTSGAVDGGNCTISKWAAAYHHVKHLHEQTKTKMQIDHDSWVRHLRISLTSCRFLLSFIN